MIAIELPLEPSINRCLGHGHRVGEQCDRLDRCARHVTIRHDARPVPACYRACSSELMAAYMPIEGFPERDES